MKFEYHLNRLRIEGDQRYLDTPIRNDPYFRGDRYVTVYAVTRHYGGREEGGWWFNRYTHVESTRCIQRRKLDHWRARLWTKYRDQTEGDINSVLGGTEFAVLTETRPGQYTTRGRPHYE
jgi:hypothetical protein